MNKKKIQLNNKPLTNNKSINLTKKVITNNKIINTKDDESIFISNKIIAQRYVYNTPSWKKLRLHKLRSNPLCEECIKENKIVLAEQVHHIIPFMSIYNGYNTNEIIDLGLDYNNLQSLCDECHNKKHHKYTKDTK